MKENINCNKQVLDDALANGSFNILCEFYNYAKRIIAGGGLVNIYEEYFVFRRDKIFDNWDDFKAWFKAAYPGIECESK